MAAKEIHFSQNARADISRGVNTLANAVKVTLGQLSALGAEVHRR